MDNALPDAVVTGYEHLIDSIELPDRDDRHVVAAAVRCGASVIVTLNLADFPGEALAKLSIEAQRSVFQLPDHGFIGQFAGAYRRRFLCELDLVFSM